MAKTAIAVASTVINYNYKLLDFKATDKAIKSIHSKGAALRKLAHETAVGMVLHLEQHGDNTKFIPMRDAIAATLGGNQAKAFVEWTLAYTDLVFDDQTKKFTKDATKTFDIEGAKATPFFAMEKVVEEKPFDMQKAITDLLNRASKAAEGGKIVNDDGRLAHLKSAIEAFKPAAKVELEKVVEGSAA